MAMTYGEFSVSSSPIMRPPSTGVCITRAYPPLTAVIRAFPSSPVCSGRPTILKLVCISIPENGGAVSKAASCTPGAFRIRSNTG